MIKTKPDYMQFSKDELQAYRRRFAKLWDAIPHLTADIEDEEERQALLLVLFCTLFYTRLLASLVRKTRFHS